MEQIKKRIQWVDIYKGLVILLVVIGHATGRFNMFIYQFHMAAFFFISGYTTNLNKRTISETLYDKLCTLLIPFFTVFIGLLGVVTVLNKVGIYNILFDSSFIGAAKTIQMFLKTGNNYVLWMGASWFILVLFGIFILHKTLYTLCGSRVNLPYAVCTIMFFLCGYHLVKIGYIPKFSFDLIFIGQMYFFLGVVAKKTKLFERLQKFGRGIVPIFMLTIGILWYLGTMKYVTVDYPSRHFINPALNLLAAVNGIFFCYFLAKLVEQCPKAFKNAITYMGRNTLGILYFHFMFFNVGFYLLYLCGIVPFTYLQHFIPTDEIGRTYWPIFAIVSIVLSLLLWKLLCLIPLLPFILGQERRKYQTLWSKFCQMKSIARMIQFKNSIWNHTAQIPWDTYWKNAMTEIKEHKALSIAIGVFSIVTFVPLIQPNIMCNDELQSRFWSLQGTKTYFDHMIAVHIGKGRALSSYLVSTTMYMGFIGVKEGIFRIIPAITILIDAVLFGYLLFKIFNNKYFSLFTSIFTVSFLPITFEFTAPNAFSALYNIPFMFFLTSLILYLDYLEKKRKGLLALSLILFFITMTSYEMFVTYTPLYFLLAWHKKPEKNWSIIDLIKQWALPLITALIFLLLYIMFGKLYPSNYEGNQIGGFTLASSLAIISQLFQASFPGYFLFNKKYQYLFGMFVGDLSPWQFISLRILFFTALLTIICWLVFQFPKKEKKSSGLWYHLGIISSGLCFVILPTFPLAVSKMYQGNVNENSFTALPVTFFTYFSAVFVVCYLIWLIKESICRKKFLLVLAVGIALYCLPIQLMNDVILEQQLTAYGSLTATEALFETQTLKQINHQMVFSEDIYKTRNALAIHDGYWTQYAQTKGLDINLSRNDEGQAIYLAYPNDDYFVLSTENDVVLLSKVKIEGKRVPVKVGKSGVYVDKVMTGAVYDDGFYVYKFTVDKENQGLTNMLQARGADYIPFLEVKHSVGNTLNSSEKIEGYWNDGWVTNKSSFRIHSGKEGKLIVSGCYPIEPTGSERIKAFINGSKAVEFTITEQLFTFEVPCEKDRDVVISFETEFALQPTAKDSRILSFVLSNLEGK